MQEVEQEDDGELENDSLLYNVQISVSIINGGTTIRRALSDKWLSGDAVARSIRKLVLSREILQITQKFCGHQELEEPQQDLFNGDQF